MNEADREKLVSLAQHEGWHTLVRVYAEVRDGQYLRLAKALMQGTEISPVELAEKRGYYRGIGEMLTTPDRALKALLQNMDAVD